MNLRLMGKTAIITGGSKGIGKGIAKVFHEQGAKILIAGRDEDRLVNVAKSLDADVVTCVADVTQAQDMEKMAKMAHEAFGQIDILVNNAGIYPVTPLHDMTEKQWDEVCNTNLKGTFLAVKACLPFMEERAYGRIVLVSSITGPKVAQPGLTHYAASKAGMNGFVKSAALELAQKGITVNGVEPGNIITEGLEESLERCPDTRNALIKAIPMGYLGTPEDVANAVLFLASDEARYITGETIVVDGGQILPEYIG